MSQQSERLPALVGGYPIELDLVPSIICSALYVLLLPVFIYRFYSKASRTTVLFATSGLILERTVAFGLRAAVFSEARTEEGFQDSEGLMEYLQTTVFMGVVPIAQDLSMLVRTLLVNATYGSEAAKEIPRLQENQPRTMSDVEDFSNDKLSSMGGKEDSMSLKTLDSKSGWMSTFTGTTMVDDGPEEYPDQPRLRFWFRRIHDTITLVFVAVMATGWIGNCRLITQRHDAEKLKENEILRYASSVLTIVILVFITGLVIWARFTLMRFNKRATKYVLGIVGLLLVPAIYRFRITSQYTSAFYSFEPSAQNHLSAKIIFYIINVLPEWLAVLVCISINVRQIFQTGLDGDSKWWDETPAEKEKRLSKEKEKQLKRGDNLISVPVISKLSRGRFVLPLVSS